MTTAALMVAIVVGSTTIARAAGPDWDALAKHTVSLSDRQTNPRGVCAVPGGGELAFALARASEFYVVAQEIAPEAMQAACARADREGLLERRMTIAEGPRGTCILADCYANLLVLTGVTDAELPRLDAQQILRKLAPHGGQAVIGLARGENGTLSKAGLESWAKGLALPTARVIEDAAGLWTVVTRPPLPDSAEWTHRFYRAHNNPYSEDTAFHWPPMTQWLGKPYTDGGSLGLMAGGRVLVVWSGSASKSGRQPDKSAQRSAIVARDAYNGQVLWRRQLDPAYGPDRRLSPCVALADAFLLIEPFTANVLVLDPASGKEVRRFSFGGEGREAKWIGFADGILCVLIGPVDRVPPVGDQWRWFERQYKADPYNLDLGDTLTALELSTGKVLWQQKEAKPCIHEANVGLHNGRVHFLARQRYVACLDAQSGKDIWRSEGAAVAWQAMADQRVKSSFGHQGGLLCSDKAVVVYIPNVGGLGVSATDGSVLWRYRGAYHPLIRGNLVFTASGAYGPREDTQYANAVFDVLTGNLDPAWQGKVPVGSACGSISQSKDFHCGSWGITFDFARGVALSGRSYIDHRNNCNAVGLFAEGLLFQQAYECTCGYKTTGQVMEIGAGDFQVGREAVEAERLRRSDRLDVALPAAKQTDWPVFRANEARGASSKVQVPAEPVVRWQSRPSACQSPPYNTRSPETAYEPLAPTAVGEQVFASGPDGAVRALGLTDGKHRWSFYTGGRLYGPPAFWNGRLYVGSGDGFVYCLDSQTGRELWRFQAAPAERRVFAYGHLVSTWPVTMGILVRDGVVYFGASLLNNNGTHVYALDAIRGTIRWQNNSSGVQNSQTLVGVTPAGTPTIAQGRLWVRGISYDLADGACGAAKESGPLVGYTGRFADDVLLVGGWRFYDDQNDLKQLKSGETGIRAVQVAASGTDTRRSAALAGKVIGFAAWDDRQMVALPYGGYHSAKAPGAGQQPRPDALVSWPASQVRAYIAAQFALDRKNRDDIGWLESTVRVLPAEQWRVERDRWFAVALAGNAVVGAYGVHDTSGKEESRWQRPGDRWFVAAMSRDDGKELWRTALPSVPLEDGLAIAGDGTVLVQLLDGTIVAVGTTR